MLRRTTLSSLTLTLALAGSLGCAASSESACQVGSDCPSGACSANGMCVPVDDDDGGGGSATGGQGGSSVGGSSVGGQGGAGGNTGGGGLCPANGDAMIEASELVLGAGLSANLRVAQGAQVDTAGATQPDGSRAWDFTVDYPGDHASVVETLDLSGLWYADEFPNASYAARLTDADDLLGVYQVTPDKLLLLGVVSPDDGVGRTELNYDPPVVILDLPISMAKTWSTNSTVTGLAQGVGVFYVEDYTFTVDANGTAETPLGSFDVLRVHSELVRTIGALPTTIQSHAFMSECFGTVASATSEPNEMTLDFVTASEVRRLSP